MVNIDVYLPATGSRHGIDTGSGIVGTRLDRGGVLVDYEGNRHGYANVSTYADKVHIAAGRHSEKYPTIARSTLRDADVVRIGFFDNTVGHVVLGDGQVSAEDAQRLLAAWLGVPVGELDAQLWTTSYHHMTARGVRV